MANAIDDAGGSHRNPDHLHSPHSQTGSAEQCQVDDHHHAHSLPAVAGVEIALNPVAGRAMAKLGHGFLVFAFCTIEFCALPENFFDAVRLWAVRVFDGFALGVVFAVDRHPLFGHLAGTEPEPEAEEMRRQRVQIHRTMRLMAVQIDGHTGDGDVRRHQCIQNDFPPAPRQQTMCQPVKSGIKKHHRSPLNNPRWPLALNAKLPPCR